MPYTWEPSLGPLKESTRVIDEQHVDISLRCAKALKFWNNVMMHVEELIRIRALKSMFFGNAAVRVFIMDMQTNAVMRRA